MYVCVCVSVCGERERDSFYKFCYSREPWLIPPTIHVWQLAIWERTCFPFTSSVGWLFAHVPLVKLWPDWPNQRFQPDPCEIPGTYLPGMARRQSHLHLRSPLLFQGCLHRWHTHLLHILLWGTRGQVAFSSWPVEICYILLLLLCCCSSWRELHIPPGCDIFLVFCLFYFFNERKVSSRKEHSADL